MRGSIATITALLEEIAGHLKADTASERTAARKKLERIVAVASTMALTLKVKH